MSNEKTVQFNSRSMVAGLLAGVGIALGVPAITLGLGHDLTAKMQLIIIIIAVAFGGLTALTTAFFGMVIPSSVSTTDAPRSDPPPAPATKSEYTLAPRE